MKRQIGSRDVACEPRTNARLGVGSRSNIELDGTPRLLEKNSINAPYLLLRRWWQRPKIVNGGR
jgi:hypothetical protein